MKKILEEMMWGATLSVTMRTMPMMISGIKSIGVQMAELLSKVEKGSPEHRRLSRLLTGIGGLNQILQAVDGMASAMVVDMMEGHEASKEV